MISDFLPKAPQNSRETSKDCSGDSTLSPNSDLRKSPFPFNGGGKHISAVFWVALGSFLRK